MEEIVIQPMQWSSLSDIEAVDHELTSADAACLAELRAVLQKHQRLDRFGVTLLHKHFELSEDECLLETVDIDGRRLLVQPVLRSALPPAVQTQWRLASNEPTQWCSSYCMYTKDGGHRFQHEQRGNKTMSKEP